MSLTKYKKKMYIIALIAASAFIPKSIVKSNKIVK